jgi:hypothetical protein
MERAHHVLSASARGPDALPDAGLRRRRPAAHVAAALAGIGRAFGAARGGARARRRSGDDDTSDDRLAGFPFRRWNRAERQIAPPLVVEVDGGDLQVGGLPSSWTAAEDRAGGQRGGAGRRRWCG